MKRIVWTDPAKTDVPGREELRLRIGDYRLFLVCTDADTVEIRRVVIAAKPTDELRSNPLDVPPF